MRYVSAAGQFGVQHMHQNIAGKFNSWRASRSVRFITKSLRGRRAR